MPSWHGSVCYVAWHDWWVGDYIPASAGPEGIRHCSDTCLQASKWLSETQAKGTNFPGTAAVRTAAVRTNCAGAWAEGCEASGAAKEAHCLIIMHSTLPASTLDAFMGSFSADSRYLASVSLTVEVQRAARVTSPFFYPITCLASQSS